MGNFFCPLLTRFPLFRGHLLQKIGISAKTIFLYSEVFRYLQVPLLIGFTVQSIVCVQVLAEERFVCSTIRSKKDRKQTTLISVYQAIFSR